MRRRTRPWRANNATQKETFMATRTKISRDKAALFLLVLISAGILLAALLIPKGAAATLDEALAQKVSETHVIVCLGTRNLCFQPTTPVAARKLFVAWRELDPWYCVEGGPRYDQCLEHVITKNTRLVILPDNTVWV